MQEATTKQQNNENRAAFNPELFVQIITLRALTSFGDPVARLRAGSDELAFFL